MTEKAREIIKEARYARKHDYRTYEYFKNRIYDLGLTYIDQEEAIKQIAKILGV